jgi:hypothetical protein
MLVDAATELGCEKLPIDSFGSRTKGRHRHLRKPKIGLLPRCLVPDFGDDSMEVVRLAMERILADCADKAFDRGAVNLVRFDALPACVARQPRQSDAMPRFRKLRQQLGPTRAQGALC